MPKNKKPLSNADIENEFDDEISKSALKRESDAKQKLGESLAELTSQQLNELDISDQLRRAVDDLKRLLKKGSRAHGGMKRQKQYIGKLMRQTDVEPIQAKLDEWQNISNASKQQLHLIEDWRERIINQGDTAIEALYQSLDLTDQGHRQYLRQLHRQAKKEIQNKKSPKASRLMFKYLRDEVFSDSENSSYDSSDILD